MSGANLAVLIAANPKSGRGSSKQRVAALREALVAAGYQPQVVSDLAAVQKQAMQLHQLGSLAAVVAAGGDGTADALANLLPAGVPILLFPLGTENLLARYLRIDGDVQRAVSILQASRTVDMDVGSANGQLFLVMLSCGFDAEVVRQMHAVRRGHITRWSYARPICRALWRYRFERLAYAGKSSAGGECGGSVNEGPVGSDCSAGGAVAGEAAWLFVFNVPMYAAGLQFCPQADPYDGQLDICAFDRGGIVTGIGYLSRVWMGSHQRMAGFRHRRCAELSVAVQPGSRPAIDVPFQVDGDPGGMLPLSLRVLPGRLTLLVPPEMP